MRIDLTERRRLGRRGPEVTRLGLGCAPIGNLFRSVSDTDAHATVSAAFDAGIRFFDTAPLYGHGLSERRLGAALAERERDSFVLATKVGRLLRTPTSATDPAIFVDIPSEVPVFDFSRDGTLRSIEESLIRLGTDRLDVVHVHDPDDHQDEAREGAFVALCRLRDEGVIGAVGCGMNQVAALRRFVDEVDLDCILLAGRHTLLDHGPADELLDECLRREIGVILGGVFNSGLLADPDQSPTFDYAPASDALVARTQNLRDVAARHDTPLAAAALGFALRHPATASVVVGARSPQEIDDDVRLAGLDMPDALWADLD
jgi:D-threo-aldose 1-dehydrogenase